MFSFSIPQAECFLATGISNHCSSRLLLLLPEEMLSHTCGFLVLHEHGRFKAACAMIHYSALFFNRTDFFL
jgi:hypothetical protein